MNYFVYFSLSLFNHEDHQATSCKDKQSQMDPSWGFKIRGYDILKPLETFSEHYRPILRESEKKTTNIISP